MFKIRFIYYVTAAALLAASSHASIIVDADAFPEGTVLTDAFLGVRLQVLDGAAPGTNPRDVTSGNTALATTGERAFAFDGTNPSFGATPFEFLRAEFFDGALAVSLDFFSDDADPNGGDFRAELLAFNESGVLIDQDSADFVPVGQPATLSVSGDSISYIAAYWDEPQRTSRGGFDRLEYTPIPEPASLMALASLGAVVLLKRRQYR